MMRNAHQIPIHTSFFALVLTYINPHFMIGFIIIEYLSLIQLKFSFGFIPVSQWSGGSDVRLVFLVIISSFNHFIESLILCLGVLRDPVTGTHSSAHVLSSCKDMCFCFFSSSHILNCMRIMKERKSVYNTCIFLGSAK